MTGRKANIVGAGPNGLVAAAVLAEQGFDVQVFERNARPGGAAASGSTLGEGTIVDLGAAAHPFAYGSRAFAHFDLPGHGLQWDFHTYPLAHPLDDAESVFLHQDLEATMAQFPADRKIWQLLHDPLVRHPQEILDNATSPLLGIPPHPVLMARFGLRALPPAKLLASAAFRTRQAAALFAGSSAHSMLPLSHPFTSGFGALFGALGQSWGWPVAHGGTGSIIDALLRVLDGLGVQIHTGHQISHLAQLPDADLTFLDATPRQAVQLAGDQLPARLRRRFERWRYGTAAYKVDYLLDGPIPWKDARTAQAGTVHVIGDAAELARAERQVAAGSMPERPFVMVVQPSSADASRAPAGCQIIWSYAHVPQGYSGDAGALIDAQIQRFAPDFKDRIVQRVVTGPAQLQAWNPNLVGGDIGGGSLAGTQQFFRPSPSLNPYSLGVPGLYLCSSSTPPGGGVHGMAGWHAAHRALRDLGRH
ncbi:FAD-dependent oxidoreductase [Arthrobacter sp. MYb214]|uniref:phytoene desaturase family protein n=1 Tax=Arthrobacter sp. MYb214 TaxID=1848596 RepID=UPI000CFE26BB|nr:NAD(P)/FAD-dependent oxidoreductase [Arthrobacter sp. MYb214]PRB77998.1 FAD-dependent oxidoreductase [Arthrobacter sp. MYb214]